MAEAFTIRLVTRPPGLGVDDVFEVSANLSALQVVALKHFLNRIADGSITADETAAMEKLAIIQAMGEMDETLAAQLPAFLDLVATGADVSDVTDAIDGLLNP